jgi:hypothetical protein
MVERWLCFLDRQSLREPAVNARPARFREDCCIRFANESRK